MRIDYDAFGHCCLCHLNMQIEKVINGEIKTVLSNDYTTTEFLLNDGSRMRVAMCKKCKENLSDDDIPKIMESVIRGWQKEVERIPHWSKEKKKQFMDKYSKKKIVLQSEGIQL